MTPFLCLIIAVPDGDTIRCQSGERVRLSGIDSAEMSHCRRGRVCAPGDPIASRDNLRRLVLGKRVTVRPYKRDRYGRLIASVTVNGVDAACAQLRGGYAIYKPAWDERGDLARGCR